MGQVRPLINYDGVLEEIRDGDTIVGVSSEQEDLGLYVYDNKGNKLCDNIGRSVTNIISVPFSYPFILSNDGSIVVNNQIQTIKV